MKLNTTECKGAQNGNISMLEHSVEPSVDMCSGNLVVQLMTTRMIHEVTSVNLIRTTIKDKLLNDM